MFLYFNGDSFVAGAELGDDILPDYPGLSTEYETYKKWFSTISERRRPYISTIEKLQKERSFPGKLANKLNLQFTNNAKGGSSMDRIARTTISDLIALKKTTNNIVAIIGVTDIFRAEIATSSQEMPWKFFDWLDISSRYSGPAESEEVRNLKKYRVTNETDYHCLINYYKNIILVRDYCKLNDIPLYWINFCLNKWNKYNLNYGTDTEFSLYKEYANINFTFNWNDYYSTFEGQQIICPGGHLGESIHEFVADKLVGMFL